MKNLFFAVIISIFSVYLFCGEATVDGCVIKTISEALESLNCSDDEPDTIHIAEITILEENVDFKWYTNGSDDLVIEGTSEDTVIAFTNSEAPVSMNFVLENAQKLTLRNLTLIPEYKGNTSFKPCAMKISFHDQPYETGEIILENIIITGSTTSNTPVEYDQAAPESVTRFYGNDNPNYCSGMLIDMTPDGTINLNIKVKNCYIAHCLWNAFYFNIRNDVTFSCQNCAAYSNGGAGFNFHYIQSLVELVNCNSCYNGYGIQSEGDTTLNDTGKLFVENGSFCHNLHDGIRSNLTADGEFKRVQTCNNGQSGFNLGEIGDNRSGYSYIIKDSIITDNGSYGILLKEIKYLAAPLIERTLVANNHLANLFTMDTNSVANTLTIKDSTFFNPSGTEALHDAPNGHILFGYSGTENLKIYCENTLFAGLGTYVIRAGKRDRGIAHGGENNTFEFVSCGLPLHGPHGLAGIIKNVEGTAYVENCSSCLNNDPMFASVETQPVDSGKSFFLSVNSLLPSDYPDAEIKGWGDFINVEVETYAKGWTLFQ